MNYPNPYPYPGNSYVEPYGPRHEPLPTVQEDLPYQFPQNPYGYGAGYVDADYVDAMPTQIGGGEYHNRLRPNINLSPNATKTAHRAAQYRKEAVEKAIATTDDGSFADYDEATLASLASDAGWIPTPVGSPSPCGAVTTPTTLHGEESPSSFVTPKPRHPSINVDHLFTPPTPTKAPDPQFKAAVLDVLGFKPIELPPPPPPPPPPEPAPADSAPATMGSVPPDPACVNPDASGKNPVIDTPSSSSRGKVTDDDTCGDASGDLGGDTPGAGDSDGSSRPSKKGRLSKNDERRIYQLFEQVDNLFDAASSETSRSISSLIERWNNLSKYSARSSRWNSYQHYHRKNTQKERERTGLPNGNARQCYESFIKLPNWQDILEKSTELEMVMEDETIGQRQRAFKKLAESFQHLAQEASRDRIDSLIFLAGTSVNEDASISHLQGSGHMETFIPDMLRMSSSDFIGLAKAHIYKQTADDFIDDLVTTHGPPSDRLGDHKKPPRPLRPSAPHGKVLPPSKSSAKHADEPLLPHVEGPPSSSDLSPPPQSDGDDDDDDEYSFKHVDNRGRTLESERANCKSHFFKLFRDHGLNVPQSRGQESLPWSGLLGQLLTWGVQLIDWPADVPFPSETLRRAHNGNQKHPSQGIKGLKSKPLRILLASFEDPKTRIKIKAIPLHDLQKEKKPLIINAAPAEDSKQAFGRRQFASGKIDNKGLPAVGPSPAATRKKGSRKANPVPKAEKGAGQPPPPDAEVLEISSASPPSNRTRGKAAKKGNPIVESSDDDETPLVRPKKSKTPAAKQVMELTSDEDNEEEGEVEVEGGDMAGVGNRVGAAVDGDNAMDDATAEGWNDAVDPLDSDPDGVLAADPDDGEYDARKTPWYTKKKSPKKHQKTSARGKAKGKERHTEVDNNVHRGRTIEVDIPIPPTHPKAKQFPTPVAEPPLPEVRPIPSGTSSAAAPAAPDPARVRQVAERFERGGGTGLGRRPSAALENMEEPSAKRARTETKDVEAEAVPSVSTQEPSDPPPAQQPGRTAQPPLVQHRAPSAQPRAPSVPPLPTSVQPHVPSTVAQPGSAQPHAPPAQSRAPSVQPRAPSVQPRPMSRPPSTQPFRAPSQAPSTQPPQIPMAHPDVHAAGPHAPHGYPTRMPPTHYRSIPSDPGFPPVRPLPPNVYLRGTMRPGGPAGRGRLLYGTLGGHERGYGRGTHLHPQPRDGPMHEDSPYYESFPSRRPTNHNEGYYQGQGWEYDGYNMGEDAYPPYSYGHHQPYPRYPAPGYGEAGPSRYHGGYNHDGLTAGNGANDHMVVADNADADPAAMQMEGVESEGWVDAQGISKSTDAE